jgi:hypothetical protein
MSYRSCKAKVVFEGVVRKRGYDPASAALGTADRANVADLVNQMLGEAWESEWWDELMVVERRQYRPTWAAGSTYAAAEEVYVSSTDGGAYYRSAQNGNTGHAPAADDGTWWAVVGDDFERSISLDQSWEDQVIGMLDVQQHVFDQDPRLHRNLKPLDDVYLLGQTIMLQGTRAPIRPWVKFRLPAPQFSWTDWSASTAYAIGDVVYVETHGTTAVGECYVAIAPNTNKTPFSEVDFWELVPFPELFREYAVFAAAAEDALEDEARTPQRLRAHAERILEGLRERVVDAQGARRKAIR